MNKEQQEQLQKRYMEMQMLDAQMKQIQKQLEGVEENMNDLTQTKENIGSMKDIKIGSEILVPISNGIFIRGTLKDNSELLVNVGANTIVNKSIDDTRSLLDGQMEEVMKFREQMLQVLHKLELKTVELDKELSSLMEE